jgi:hypothetical protein
MSAEIVTTSIYDWYCADCNEGAGSFEEEETAEWAAGEHDKEYHS